MRPHPNDRDRSVAAFFAALALIALIGTVTSGSPVLGGIAAATLLVAIFALRGYPVDRYW